MDGGSAGITKQHEASRARKMTLTDSPQAQLDSTSADERNRSRPGATGDWRCGAVVAWRCAGGAAMVVGPRPGGRPARWWADDTPGCAPLPRPHLPNGRHREKVLGRACRSYHWIWVGGGMSLDSWEGVDKLPACLWRRLLHFRVRRVGHDDHVGHLLPCPPPRSFNYFRFLHFLDSVPP